jgi:hypothetical protein
MLSFRDHKKGVFSDCRGSKQYELLMYHAMERSRRVAQCHKAATFESVVILSSNTDSRLAFPLSYF